MFPSWSKVQSIQNLLCSAINFYNHLRQDFIKLFKIDSDESTVIMGAEVGTSIKGSTDSLSAPKVHVISRKEYFLNLMETAKFYTSLCLGTTAFVSVFAFLFLIPFVVDPAITTILADYDPQAVTCLATDHVYAEGLRNCSWSSCREGCTNAAIRCHQILVNYSKIPFREWSARDPAAIQWDMTETKFMVNSEGCGYPPKVNCSEFSKQYGFGSIGTPFPCYYSRTYPENVIARYNWEENLRQLILSLIIPNVLFAVSIGVLSYWYCPGCGRACNKVYMEKFPIKVE